MSGAEMGAAITDAHRSAASVPEADARAL